MRTRTRRIFATLTIFTLILGAMTSTSFAAASIKAGTSCAKPGQVKIVSSKTLVCAKVGAKSVWITAGVSGSTVSPSKSSPSTPSVAPTPTCTTGVGTKLTTQLTQDSYGLAVLTVTNSTNCNITYSLSGSMGCNYYKNQKATILGNATKSLYPNQTVKMQPSMAFPDANSTCQIYQKQSGAGPEYGAGILFFNSYNYTAMVIGISN